MKKFFITATAAILILGIGCWSFAYETDFDDLQQFDRNLPSWKFGRGIVNILSFPHELIANMTNSAIQGAYTGSYYDGLYGYVRGVVEWVHCRFRVGRVLWDEKNDHRHVGGADVLET